MYSRLALLGLLAAANAHFVLQIPTSLGFDDTVEDTAPCGSFDPTDRSKGVANWDVNGDNIGVLTTHLSVTWEINAALLANTNNWIPMVQPFAQNGVGDVCFTAVPGFSAWIGQPAVLQVIQHGPDGVLYQCAAIQFVAGGPDAVPSNCTNSAGVSFASIIAAPGPSATTSSAASSSAPSTSTTPAPTSSISPTGSGSSAASTGSSAASTGSNPTQGPSSSTSAAAASSASVSVSSPVATGQSSAKTTPSGSVSNSSSNSTATASKPAIVTSGTNTFASNSMVVLAVGMMAFALAL